jgi:hypothetical protein
MTGHARGSRTKQALWEYDSIHRSLYLLNYIDDPLLRQYVQKALNRGENYHQLRRAVSFAGNDVRHHTSVTATATCIAPHKPGESTLTVPSFSLPPQER